MLQKLANRHVKPVFIHCGSPLPTRRVTKAANSRKWGLPADTVDVGNKGGVPLVVNLVNFPSVTT